MIVYLDTSALLPLLIDEPTSRTCGDVWDAADRLVTTRLTYVEAAAALAAERLGRITAGDRSAGYEQLKALWPEFDVVELDQELMTVAANAAMTHGLRGYHSVHFAAAAIVEDEYLVAAAGDEKLLDAWRNDGIAVIDTSARTYPIPDPGADLQTWTDAAPCGGFRRVRARATSRPRAAATPDSAKHPG